MQHHDVLYGSWEVPSIVEDLIHTKEIARTRRISQAVIPHAMSPRGPMASRFDHSMGVAFLAEKILAQNVDLEESYGNLLRASALLHDAGNPPFSHLSERFLQESLGLNGESHLSVMLRGSEVAEVLRAHAISCEDVMALVTGSQKPFSDILHGSMDIDNLDNVARAAYYFGVKIPKRTFLDLAFSYRWNGVEWCLPMDMFDCAGLWKEARQSVYECIYSVPHFSASMMLYRAVELAFVKGEITNDFFKMNDAEAFSYLEKDCNEETQYLIERLQRWQWYEEAMRIETYHPTDALAECAVSWRGRKRIASVLSDACSIPPDALCVYVGAGKDNRRIHTPFTSRKGRLYDSEPDAQKTRLMVYVANEYADRKDAIHACVMDYMARS